MSISAVADAGPLIYLAEIDSLDLLGVLDRLYVPETAYEEVSEGEVPTGMTELSYESVTATAVDSIETELDAGESAALAVAIDEAAVFLTDDLAARDAASDRGVEVHGHSASSHWRTLVAG